MTAAPPFDARARELLEGWPLFDGAIVRHGFAPFMRDYDVLVESSVAAPDGSGSYMEGRYRLRFTHCVRAVVWSALDATAWRTSWDDSFIDYAAWERAGAPEGYVWGVEYMEAYPGGKLLDDSIDAAEWTNQIGAPMHEVVIETNGHRINLIFHALKVHRVGRGDPKTRRIDEIPAEDLLQAG
jgi:hypothetical protein